MPDFLQLSSAVPYVTGARRRDLILFAALLAVALALSSRLGVYSSFTLVQIQVAATDPQGRSTTLPPPALIPWQQDPAAPFCVPLPVLDRRIHHYMAQRRAELTSAPNVRIEWTISYSRNSTNLNQRTILSFPPHVPPAS